MSVKYKPVAWNRQKRIYDGVLLGALGGWFLVFALASIAIDPFITAETIIIRGTAGGAIVLLHVILAIGPLARLDRRFLPVLYNRRHLGVSLFLLALVHAAFTIVQYHAFGPSNPVLHAFTAYADDFRWPARLADLARFPFEPFGLVALAILFLMAATSHDFWLRNLGGAWKGLHLLVYVAYGSVLVHVTYGFLQDERNYTYPAMLGAGFVCLVGLHLTAWFKERAIDAVRLQAAGDGFVPVCPTEQLREGRGKVVRVGGERVGVFLHEGKAFVLSNVCRHQGGPVGEGRIIDGCITCPWHGWQYRPEDGVSPPPFKEVISTYPVKIIGDTVYVHPVPNAPETVCAGADPGDMHDEFYIGYLKKAPANLAIFLRSTSGVVVAAILFVAALAALGQQILERGTFEFGIITKLQGRLAAEPVPHIVVESAPHPLLKDGGTAVLVGEGKHGAAAELFTMDSLQANVEGSIISNGTAVMLEVHDYSPSPAPGDAVAPAGPGADEEMTVEGELVDTKCFLGVMRPGRGKVHRGCAIACLEGGVPAGIWVGDSEYSEGRVIFIANDGAYRAKIKPEWAALRLRVQGRYREVDGIPTIHVQDASLLPDGSP